MSRAASRAIAASLFAVTASAAAVVALSTVLDAYQDRIADARRPEDAVMVMVAARDLTQGIAITEDDLVAVAMPPRLLPTGVFLAPEHVLGQRPRERILANELVRADRLAMPESGQGLNAIVPRGMRALSVGLHDGAALSGLLEPGSHVDVLLTLDDPQAGPQTRTLLQGLYVLGVNGEAGAHDADARASARSVTLLVTPSQAEQVVHAERVGTMWLSLRTDDDDAFVATHGIGRRPEAPRVRRVAPPQVAPAPDPTTILMIRGDATTVEPVEEDPP